MTVDGSLRRLPGWPNESLSDALARFNTTAFHPECNGGSLVRKYSDDAVASTSAVGPKCGKCHVVISDPWFTYMKPKIHPVEMTTLEKTNQDVFPTSRLACCIGLKPWMNEIILRIHFDPNLHLDEELADANSADSSIGGWGDLKIYNY